MQKQTHSQENTVLLKNTNRNDDRFYVLCIGTWACIAFASNTLQTQMHERKQVEICFSTKLGCRMPNKLFVHFSLCLLMH